MPKDAVRTGNEPQVGGSLYSNAPMLSSRATRRVTRASRAYDAGDLARLIELMDEEFMLPFRRAVVRSALRHTERIVEVAVIHIRSVLLDRRSLHDCVRAIQHWTVQPTRSAYLDVYHSLSLLGPITFAPGEIHRAFYGYQAPHVGPLTAVQATAGCVLGNLETAAYASVEIAGYAAVIPYGDAAARHQLEARRDAAKSAARRWHIEAASAILRGAPPPSAAEPNPDSTSEAQGLSNLTTGRAESALQ